MLLMTQGKQDPHRDELLAIREAARNGGDLVKGLLTFSRKAGINPRPTNLNEEVKRVRKLLYRTIPRMIEIELVPADDLKTVNVDPGQMEQVLLNLAINARDAMPKGGRFTIETENVTLDEEYCNTHLEVKPGEYVLLQVSDTGLGMEKRILDHIFEPFYTTKEPSKGTGLGLAMVFGIVKSHGGHITCYSEPEAGTTFKIYLPVLETMTELDVETTGEMPAFGTETILLVDDEERIQELARGILSQAGYNVVTAGNGKEALELYQRQKADISLVILDLIMPKTGGAECLEKLLQIDPNVKVLVASGFSVNGPIMDALEDGAEGFIGKPYDAKELLRVVRRVLDEIGLPERRADSVKPTSVWQDGDYRAISAPPPPVSESSPWQDSPGIKEFPATTPDPCHR
jgi:two-component system cell cycle sensor histidine kinase/response regulator CckA